MNDSNNSETLKTKNYEELKFGESFTMFSSELNVFPYSASKFKKKN